MAEDSLVGKQIREYEILGIIGKGGMGTVYRARHMYLDEERAIKVIRGQFSESQNYLDRFIREARILTRLRHPNLVLLYEFGNLEKNTFFMVLELINGESVLARIRRMGRIPIDESVKIIREAALGLHAAHEQGIIHRDISPDNLLIVKREGSGQEVTKVIDFGIAKPLLETGFTGQNLYIGKPEYGAPERVGMENETVDHRSDIYSLGVTLYFMLAGSLPFTGKTPWEIMNKHLQEQPKPLSEAFGAGQFPEALSRIVLKTLAKKQSERHASMEEFVKELDQVFAPPETSKQDASDAFLEQMGHELRTRLNAIIGYSEILEEDALDQGHQQYIRDLKKIHAAGKHLLWLIGGADQGGDDDLKMIVQKSPFEKGKELYDRMKWEEAIEIWKSADQASADLGQWISSAESKIQNEKQLKQQASELLELAQNHLEAKRLIDAKRVLDDASRTLKGDYRFAEPSNKLENLRRRLDREMEDALVGINQRVQLAAHLEKTVQLMELHLPDLKKALESFGVVAAEAPVDKTLMIGAQKTQPETASAQRHTSRKKLKS